LLKQSWCLSPSDEGFADVLDFKNKWCLDVVLVLLFIGIRRLILSSILFLGNPFVLADDHVGKE
ncbi:hypothetical protein HAX54_006186, partial [Datura stramonium]|nr:hypothetical protein [Datura stramonium]